MVITGVGLRVSAMKTLLIISHPVSKNTTRLFKAIESGAYIAETDGITVLFKSAFDVQPEDVRSADALVLATTENFAYMSGALKDFFDRIYYPCLELTQGMPYGLIVRAGNDGSGTCHSIEKIATGLRWNLAQAPVICKGEWREEFITQAQEIGGFFALGLEQGII